MIIGQKWIEEFEQIQEELTCLNQKVELLEENQNKQKTVIIDQLKNSGTIGEKWVNDLKNEYRKDIKEIRCDTNELFNEIKEFADRIQFCVNELHSNMMQYNSKLEQNLQEQNNNLLRLMLKMNILETKIDEMSEKECENPEIERIWTRRFNNNFKWYINRSAHDNVTEYVRGGYVGANPDWDAIDENIWSIMPTKGTFLDLGANIGAFSLPLASFGWTGYAIEASNQNATVLEKSILENKFDITLIRKAVWDKSESIRFVEKGPQSFVEDSIHADENYETIDAICLNDYEKDEKLKTIKKIDFIKMDIEGAEVAAIRGMDKFLQIMGYPPIYTEVNIWNLFCMNESPKTLFNEVGKMGYRPYSVYKGYIFEYDTNNFPDNPCKDYLLLKEIPQNLKNRVGAKKVWNTDYNVDFVRQEMTNFKNWCCDYGTNPQEVLAHIAWYALINEYVECKEDKQIQDLMKKIADKLGKLDNAIFNKMLKRKERKTK